jgi:integrase
MAELDKKPRLKQPVRGRPYFHEIRKGLSLGYRRNQAAGVWLVRAAKGNGKSWMQSFATADDFESANGETIMNYEQAKERAIMLARGKVASSADQHGPITVEQAIDAFQADLLARGQSHLNATSVRFHLKDTSLFRMPVALLEKKMLSDVRNSLVKSGLTRSTADRVGKSFKAAMNLAASHDPRIMNVKAWANGWKLLPNATTANNIILSDAIVAALVRAAYGADRQLGIYFDVLAETGTRESQALKLRCRDLQDDRPDPRLMMWSSNKGRNRKPRQVPVPISARLASVLREVVGNRPATDFMLRKIKELPVRFRKVAKLGGVIVDPKATPYAFRHSSIVRQLLKNSPIRVVAANHDTSVASIEKHYSPYITNVSDALTRAALPDFGTMGMVA